jgi:iron complex transport system permease protein
LKRGKSGENSRGNIEIHISSEDRLADYKKNVKSRRKFSRSNRALVFLGLGFLAIFFISAALFVTVSKDHVYLSYILELARQKLANFFYFIIGRDAEGGIQFTTYRYLIVSLVGASLAAGGAVYQGAFRNVLASPTTLGVLSGGSLGNIIYVLFFVGSGTLVLRFSDSVNLLESSTIFDRNTQQILVLAGCFGAVFLITGLSSVAGKGKVRSSYLILAGIIFSAIISSFTMLVQYYLLLRDPYDARVDIIRNLTMGSFDRAYGLEHLLIIAAFLVPGLLLLLLLSRRMNLLMLGEEEASSMGLNVRAFRRTVIAVNTVMTAVVIAYCGQIGFVGFIVPQAARRIVGPDFRRVLPASMLLGATLLLVVYDLALQTGLTAYMNLFTSTFGSVMMIAAFIKGQGRTAYEE